MHEVKKGDGVTKNQAKTIPPSEFAKLLLPSLGAAFRLLVQPATLKQCPRFLHEGIDPITHLLIQANNTAVINRWLNHGTKVVFLSSFPRSGNTWLRFLLSDVLLQTQGFETTTQLPVHPDNLIPEFRCDSIASRLARCPHWAKEPPVAFVKTHALYTRLEEVLQAGGPQKNGKPTRDCRVVYLYRSPEDALVSLYHLQRFDTFARSRASLSLDDFCRKEVSRWMDNIDSHFRAADTGFPVLFFSYEGLLENPGLVMGSVLRWLGVEHDDQMVQRAVSNMQFNNLQAMEKNGSRNGHTANEKRRFFRRGGPGSGRAELQESTVQEIRERTAPLMAEADARRMKQPLAHPAATMSRNEGTKEPITPPCLQQI